MGILKLYCIFIIWRGCFISIKTVCVSQVAFQWKLPHPYWILNTVSKPAVPIATLSLSSSRVSLSRESTTCCVWTAQSVRRLWQPLSSALSSRTPFQTSLNPHQYFFHLSISSSPWENYETVFGSLSIMVSKIKLKWWVGPILSAPYK